MFKDGREPQYQDKLVPEAHLLAELNGWLPHAHALARVYTEKLPHHVFSLGDRNENNPALDGRCRQNNSIQTRLRAIEVREVLMRLHREMNISYCIGQAKFVRLGSRILFNSIDFGLPDDNFEVAKSAAEMLVRHGLSAESIRIHRDEKVDFNARLCLFIQEYAVLETLRYALPIPRVGIYFDGKSLKKLQ